MAEFLVRSGEFNAIVQAESRVKAIETAIRIRSEDTVDPIEFGAVTQVINLDECEAATWYTKTEDVLHALQFKEPESCGAVVTPTNLSSLN